jgi:hypothetical protein
MHADYLFYNEMIFDKTKLFWIFPDICHQFVALVSHRVLHQ